MKFYLFDALRFSLAVVLLMPLFNNMALARYVQPDPIGQQDGINIYTYVRSTPLNYFDPLGLQRDTITAPIGFSFGAEPDLGGESEDEEQCKKNLTNNMSICIEITKDSLNEITWAVRGNCEKRTHELYKECKDKCN